MNECYGCEKNYVVLFHTCGIPKEQRLTEYLRNKGESK